MAVITPTGWVSASATANVYSLDGGRSPFVNAQERAYVFVNYISADLRPPSPWYTWNGFYYVPNVYTFPAIPPTYGAQKTNEPKIKEVQFGDGYEQRVTFGLNQNPVTWDLSWENIAKNQADAIDSFLSLRAVDGASFNWVPPEDTLAYRWTCKSWRKSIPYKGRATINATFRQVFEP